MLILFVPLLVYSVLYHSLMFTGAITELELDCYFCTGRPLVDLDTFNLWTWTWFRLLVATSEVDDVRGLLQLESNTIHLITSLLSPEKVKNDITLDLQRRLLTHLEGQAGEALICFLDVFWLVWYCWLVRGSQLPSL